MSLSPVRAPAPGETVTVDAAVFVSWCVRALAVLSRVARDPSGLIAVLERVKTAGELQVRVVDRPRRLRDRELRGMSDAEWCLPDTIVMVSLPEDEGLAAYARSAGLSAKSSVGVPRAALRLSHETL